MKKFILILLVSITTSINLFSQGEYKKGCDMIVLQDNDTIYCAVIGVQNEYLYYRETYQNLIDSVLYNSVKMVFYDYDMKRATRYETIGEDHLIMASNSLLAGVGLSFVGMGAALTQALVNPEKNLGYYIGGGIGFIGLCCTIAGYVQIGKAGKKMKQERKLVLNGSFNGVGIAYRF